jgi:hypothetical protein
MQSEEAKERIMERLPASFQNEKDQLLKTKRRENEFTSLQLGVPKVHPSCQLAVAAMEQYLMINIRIMAMLRSAPLHTIDIRRLGLAVIRSVSNL